MSDPAAEPTVFPPAPPLVALAGWAVPGLGYLLIGQRARALYAGVAIVLIFLGGILIAGVRCVDVPGYDSEGNLRRLGRSPQSKPYVQQYFFRAVLDKPWYIPQVLAGPMALGTSVWSVKVSDHVGKSTGRLWDIGTLYTAVAGMLNLLVMLDAAHRAAKLRDAHPDANLGPM